LNWLNNMDYVTGEDIKELCEQAPEGQFLEMDYVGAGWDHDTRNVCRIPTQGGISSEGQDIQVFGAESGNIEWAHAGIGGEVSSNAQITCEGPKEGKICKLGEDTDDGYVYWIAPSEY